MLDSEHDSLRPADTTPDAWRHYIDVLRRLGPERRVEMMMEMSESHRETLREGIRTRHPDYDEKTVTLALIRITAGEDVFRRLLPGIDVEP